MTERKNPTKASAQAAVSEEQQERSHERAEKAQDQAPDNITCELCHHKIEADADWDINPGTGGYKHKDGNCPEVDEADEPVEKIRLGDDEYKSVAPVDKSDKK